MSNGDVDALTAKNCQVPNGDVDTLTAGVKNRCQVSKRRFDS